MGINRKISTTVSTRQYKSITKKRAWYSRNGIGKKTRQTLVQILDLPLINRGLFGQAIY